MNVACVGSREISAAEEKSMEIIGAFLARRKDFVLTGNALGSDQAFARGANSINPAQVELFLPWKTYESSAIVKGNILHLEEATAEEKYLAAHCHPAWARLNQAVQKLMTRNAMIVCRSRYVIARLNPNKQGGGGTGHGVRIAQALGLKVFDISKPEVLNHILNKIKETE